MMRKLSNRDTERLHGSLTSSPKLGYRGKDPADDLWESFQYYGVKRFLTTTAADQTGCSFSSSDERQIPVFEQPAVPPIQHLTRHRRRHSMPPVLNHFVTGKEGGDKQCHSDHCADLLLVSPTMRKQRSMGPAIGESSLQRHNNAKLFSSDTVVRSYEITSTHDPIHAQVSDHDSATSSTQASFTHTVLNMTQSAAESRRTFFSLESRENIGPVLHLPSHESRRIIFPRNVREEETPLSRPRLTETSLGITAQAALALLTIRSSGSTSNLSGSAKMLLRYAVVCNIVGFLCCIIGVLVGGHRPGLAARITTGVGYIATIYGFVAVVSMQLNDNLKLWITAAAWIALFPILLAFALRRI